MLSCVLYRDHRAWWSHFLFVIIWPTGLKVRTQPFQGCNARFKSGGDHCGYSTTVSAADRGSAYPGSTPGSHPMGW